MTAGGDSCFCRPTDPKTKKRPGNLRSRVFYRVLVGRIYWQNIIKPILQKRQSTNDYGNTLFAQKGSLSNKVNLAVDQMLRTDIFALHTDTFDDQLQTQTSHRA